MRKQVDVHFSSEELIKDLHGKKHHGEMADFVSGLAEVIDENCSISERADVAKIFAEGLSENGCRFLTEVVCQYHFRNTGTKIPRG